MTNKLNADQIIEKINIEEIILSRISSDEYFQSKILFIFNPFLKWFFLLMISFLISNTLMIILFIQNPWEYLTTVLLRVFIILVIIIFPRIII